MLDRSAAANAWDMDAGRTDYEVIIVGAGVSGIYQLYRLREIGIRSTVLETGGDVGGTWYWNRYPGARFDSESVSYAYSFSEELLAEWDWRERFAAQPETERYLRHVVDKFDLRKHMQFNCTVTRAFYDEETGTWTVGLADGRALTTKLLITGIGPLSAPTLPRYPGMESFRGMSFHTSNWPADPVDLRGKRVAVIGTGATGVQVISEIADKVGDLTVFQRRPNWCAPLHNAPITQEEMQQLKASYAAIFETCKNTPSGFLHATDCRKTFEVPREERIAFWEKLYNSPGFGIWLGNFSDVLTDEEANAALTEFVAGKIRQRVRDPATAEKLIPKDHGFGTRRVPMETRYYEVYNRDNVKLVDVSQEPIQHVDERGIQTSARCYEFDIIIYATGFDAITGAFDRIDFAGKNGRRLRDKWAEGPRTMLGVMTAGFPNLFTVAGPQSGSVLTNFPRGIEEVVEWCTGLVSYMKDRGYRSVEPKQDAEDEWVVHVQEMADRVLLSKQRSWFTGYNSNIDHGDKKRHLTYTGGAIRYRERLRQQVETGYSGFTFL